MFFVLSKILSALMAPFTVICLLLIASVIVRNLRWKKWLFRTGFILLVFCSNEFIANEIMRAWEVDPTPISGMGHYKLAIVLTGATIPNLEPNDRVYFHRGADRVIHTVQLYKLGIVEKILISGGTGSLTGSAEPEADKFKRTMVMMGVAEDHLIIENATRNTAESAIEVRKLLRDSAYRSDDCLLITSAFHMRRSLACYQKVGLDPQPFSTDFYAHPTEFSPPVLFIPQLDALAKWHKLTKEWVGMIAYKAVGYI
jgi:uncharacterized SAM-binding protein YcdF (DUF218 family)